MKTPLGPPPEGTILLFAGSADIDERNMNAQLDDWLPSDLQLDLPVIQRNIPDRYAGLRKARRWLGEMFPGNFDETDDIAGFISGQLTAEELSRTILVVLWGDGGDEPTEKLVDLAMRCDIPVLDLASGLDTLELGDRKPPETPAAARRTRRSRPRQDSTGPAEAPAASPAQEPAPWEPDPPQPATYPGPALTAILAQALRAALAVLEEHEHGPAAPAESPGPTTKWLRNPASPGEYRYRGRGRVRQELKDWEEVQLTEQQVKALGLQPPGR